MPKRLLDGDRLWRSDKLKQVQPESFRAEYANIYPLALANGSFECTPERVWYEVYAYNRPSISTENVQAILDEFERVKLLFRWHDASNKQWGFWVGCEKTLPTPAQIAQSRYKAGESVPVEQLTTFLGSATCKTSAANELHVLGLDWNGMDRNGEEDMNLKNALTDKSREILGVRLSPQDSNWSEIKALVRVYGEDAVVDKFEAWAKTLTQIPNYPLSGFVRIADGLLSGKFSKSCPPEQLDTLLKELIVVSDGRVVFNNNQKQTLAGLLSENSVKDVVSAFAEFWGNIENNEFKVGGAARDFVEGAEQLLFLQARRRAKQKETEELLARCTENEQKRAAEEQLELARKQTEEESMIEENLL